MQEDLRTKGVCNSSCLYMWVCVQEDLRTKSVCNPFCLYMCVWRTLELKLFVTLPVYICAHVCRRTLEIKVFVILPFYMCVCVLLKCYFLIYRKHHDYFPICWCLISCQIWELNIFPGSICLILYLYVLKLSRNWVVESGCRWHGLVLKCRSSYQVFFSNSTMEWRWLQNIW